MRVLILTHHFPPEIGAPATRLSETAQKLQELGHQVTVLTCMPHYPTGRIPRAYRGKLFLRETIDGVTVARTWVWAMPNTGFFRRIIDQFSFALTSLLGGAVTGRCDVLITDSPPLILGLSGYLLSRAKRARFVFNVADLWPESAVALGVIRNRMAIAGAERMASFIYRKAHLLTVVTRGIRSELIRRGLPETKVAHVPNGVDADFFRPGSPNEELRLTWGSKAGHVVLYAGNIGLAQGLDIVLDAAELLCEESDVRFVIVGEGGDKQRLVDRARRENIHNVVFMPSRPHSEMPALINSANAVLVLLRAHKLFEGALPSKTYEAMACEKPLVLAARGEAKRLVTEAGAGLVVEPEQPKQLAKAILYLKQHPREASEMGKRGRQYALKHLGRSAIVKRLEHLMQALIKARGRPGVTN